MTATADRPQTRPVPGPGPVEAAADGAGELRAELVESDTGWTLTLHLDPTAARTIRTQLSGHVVTELELGSVTASVLPNLVPGEPFAVDRLAVIVSDEPADGPDAVSGDPDRPLPG
jgi:hypothetical protein